MIPELLVYKEGNDLTVKNPSGIPEWYYLSDDRSALPWLPETHALHSEAMP